MTLRIANAAGFLGDWIDAPRRLVQAAQVDYLTLEYLAELTLSILARQREKRPELGYAGDFFTVLQSLTPELTEQSSLKIVTNAGGVNPLACAAGAARILADAGLGDLSIGVVTGDDLLPQLDRLRKAGCDFDHLESGQPLSLPSAEVVSANAYLGAAPIVDALSGGARMVITGRVADASLTVGPAAHHYGWKWDDYDTLSAASVAGHLIECGAQVTGGYSSRWRQANLADVGYPIAEINSDGSCVITKPDGTGGQVNRQSVVEQLVYEIGDPQHYLTPDVDVDFTTVEVEPLGENRVAVGGATGRAPPSDYKVSLSYRDGFTASGQLLVVGRDCLEKARECADIIRQRLQASGCEPEQALVEFLGAGQRGGAGLIEEENSPREVVMRVAVHDARQEVVQRFTKEIAPLVTGGPAGLAGYAVGRPRVQSVPAYWPTLIPKTEVQPLVEIRAAKDWLGS